MTVKPLSVEDLEDAGECQTWLVVDVKRLKELFAELSKRTYRESSIMDGSEMVKDKAGSWIHEDDIQELFGPLVKE